MSVDVQSLDADSIDGDIGEQESETGDAAHYPWANNNLRPLFLRLLLNFHRFHLTTLPLSSASTAVDGTTF